MANQYTNTTPEQRFWKNIRVNPVSECWEWLGAKDTAGYGRLSVGPRHGSKIVPATRFSYALRFGSPPRGKVVLHTCNTRSCCNPQHLYINPPRPKVIVKEGNIRTWTRKVIERQIVIDGEEWRSIPMEYLNGNYEVSNLARVRSVKRGTVMCSFIHHSGYPCVRLTERPRVVKSYQIHRLVAAAFLGKPEPTRTQVNHKNGVRGDSNSANLEYVTPRENTQHARKILKTGNCKLSEGDIKEIRTRAAAGEFHYILAAHFNVAQSSVTRIVNRRTWVHVT